MNWGNSTVWALVITQLIHVVWLSWLSKQLRGLTRRVHALEGTWNVLYKGRMVDVEGERADG